MPLPIGHATIGFTACSLLHRDGSSSQWWKTLCAVLVLSNLPDLDVILGFLLRMDGSAFHRGPTHSLAFALIVGCVASRLLRAWSQPPGLSFKICFMMILSHILADSFFTNSPISFFWPIAVNWSEGHSNLGEVFNMVLFGNHQDVTIILGCALLLLLHRDIRAAGGVILFKYLKINSL